MKSRNYYRGRGMPLKKNNIDTDQIMPARFCYKPTRRGHEHSVFGDWRVEADFVMNNPNYQRATILVAGREFATGSSREFAVWGLKDWGFKVVIAPSFGDIFYKNASINDLLPIMLDERDVETLWKLLLEDHYTEINIDLEKECVFAKDHCFTIHIETIVKRRYVENLNEIKESLSLIPLIEQYELEKEK
ncbi:3-isopropylmalate dehydratase small subunit [Photobacterium leiognathi subsp. mandapamensis]|uniref:3-isopropylmalate dehydratase small subunit n=1 Tax=Photobacterium leiognathi TaxID=553611 RepID=UPI003AF363BA